MKGSRKIFILKRDGSIEPFDKHKLRACLLRALPPHEGCLDRATALSSAIRCYIIRRRERCVTSAAVMEMVLAALRAVSLPITAERMEDWHAQRLEMRNRLVLHHSDTASSNWSKDWLVQQAKAQWGIGTVSARIIAGHIERILMAGGCLAITRAEVIAMLEQQVSAFGLVLACPLQEAGWPA